MIQQDVDYEDYYDDALKWAIEEIINNIHFIKDREDDVIDSIYYTLFDQEMVESYYEYTEDQRI